jgi:hypothetical protein
VIDITSAACGIVIYFPYPNNERARDGSSDHRPIDISSGGGEAPSADRLFLKPQCICNQIFRAKELITWRLPKCVIR